MNRGLIIRALRELWPVIVVIGAALFVFEAILGYALPTLERQITGQLLQFKFLQGVISAMIGTDVNEGALGPQIFASICWVHPVPLALMWAYAIVACTRVPAGEVDRGTIDVLLGLPVSRMQVFLSESLAVLIGGAVIVLFAAVGNILGSMGVAPEFRVPLARLPIVLVNLFALLIAVGGLAWLMSSLSDRRGRAMTVAFLVLLALFLLNYLAQFWEPAKHLSFLSILHYHKPVIVLRDGSWPVRDLLVLMGVATITWSAGGVIFARRDLCTV